MADSPEVLSATREMLEGCVGAMHVKNSSEYQDCDMAELWRYSLILLKIKRCGKKNESSRKTCKILSRAAIEQAFREFDVAVPINDDMDAFENAVREVLLNADVDASN